jgi:hypothetical protein
LKFFFLRWLMNTFFCFIKSCSSAQWIWSLCRNILLRNFIYIFTILIPFTFRSRLYICSFFRCLSFLRLFPFLLMVLSFFNFTLCLRSQSLIYIFFFQILNFIISLRFVVYSYLLNLLGIFYITLFWMNKLFRVIVDSSSTIFTCKIIRIYLFI